MNLDSVLDSVTMYREGAVCRRLAVLPAGTRPDEVRVGGLPLALTAGSLRAQVTTPGARTRVVDVRAAFDVAFTEAVDASAEQKAVNAAEEAVAALTLEVEQLERDINELQSLQPRPLEPKRGDPPRAAALDAALALADFVESRLAQRLASRRAVAKQLTEAEHTLALRRRRLTEASVAQRTERAKVSRAVVVRLAGEASDDQPLELALEYIVPGARWVPNYQLRLARGFTGGTLLMRASVVQDSGEDWSNVTLALSTASLNRRSEVPELKSLRIGRAQQEPPRSGWREPPPGLDALFEAYDASQRLLPRAEPVPASFGAPLGQAMKPKAGRAKERPQRELADLASSFADLPAPAPAAAPVIAAAPSMMRARSVAKKAAMSEEVAAPPPEFDEEGATDEYEKAAAPAAVPRDDLSENMRDYQRLTLGGFDAPPAARGRLGPADPWGFVFAAGVNVQVDVLVAVIGAAEHRAARVASTPPPAGCVRVTALGEFDYRYECQGRLDVPSSASWVTVPVMACNVGLTPQYVCVPAVEPKVYRTLAIANTSTHALLPGPVDVSAGDEFLMTTSLPAIAPGSTTERLGLGVEEAIKVARKTQYNETTGGFLGGSAVLPHEVSIEINNRLATAAPLEVRERVPYPDPSEKDVKVEETSVTPAWEKVDRPVDGAFINGARRWVLHVPAGATAKLVAQFAIRIPADRMLVGGNRRN